MNSLTIAGIIFLLTGVNKVVPIKNPDCDKSIREKNETRRTEGIILIFAGVMVLVGGWILSFGKE